MTQKETRTYAPGGHAFKLDKDGYLHMRYYRDYYSYECAKCRSYIIPNRDPNWKEQKCPNLDETLPGLEFD